MSARNLRRAAVLVATLLLAGCDPAPDADIWFEIRIGSTPLGWVAVTLPDSQMAADEPITARAVSETHLSLLDQDVDQVTVEDFTFAADGVTLTAVSRRTDAGSIHVQTGWRVDGDSLEVALPGGGGRLRHSLPDDLDRTTSYQLAPILDALRAAADSTVSRRTIDPTRGRLVPATITWKGRDTLVVAQTPFVCDRFTVAYPAVGVHSVMWADAADGLLVKVESSDGAVVLRSDATIRDRIERYRYDEKIMARVDVEVDDPRAIRRLHVRAVIQSGGPPLDADALSVDGQRFEGRVERNRIDGEFVVEHPGYDGSDAPPLGAPVDSGLARYLRPEPFIESDDAILVAKARRLVGSSEDSWAATRAIATWVNSEIGYAIPGGGSARGTFDARRGECGGHSRLMVALCRAVGIPARMVVGCMLFDREGSAHFGQHGWVEVWMGDANGWIPVDPTLGEIDRLDSGHVRLGEEATFQPVSMEVLALDK